MNFWTVPNILTYIRFLLIPVFIACMIFGHTMWALAIFLLASGTDLLDGILARKLNQVTIVGTLLDPLADKLMQITAICCLYIYDRLPIWVLLTVLLKETTMIIGGIVFYKKKYIRPANMFGKVATALFVVGILLAFLSEWVAPWHVYVLGLAVASSLVAFVQYIYLAWEGLFKKDHKRNGDA